MVRWALDQIELGLLRHLAGDVVVKKEQHRNDDGRHQCTCNENSWDFAQPGCHRPGVLHLSRGEVNRGEFKSARACCRS